MRDDCLLYRDHPTQKLTSAPMHSRRHERASGVVRLAAESRGLQWRLNISHGRWTPWGVLLLLPAVVGVVLTLILVRLRCLGRAEPAGDGTR